MCKCWFLGGERLRIHLADGHTFHIFSLQTTTAQNGGGGGGPKMRNLNLGGHVGFNSLPDQLVNQSVTAGFTFNIMCIGETGLGKSTLMDSLFNTNFDPSPASHKEVTRNMPYLYIFGVAKDLG